VSHFRKHEKIKILFVAANPAATNRLMLDEEIHQIENKILVAEYRDRVDIKSIWAARPDDLLQAFNRQRPNIVHFSAHGSANGQIMLTDNNGRGKPVSTQSLQALFTALKDDIRVVVLNACYSKIQAQAIISSIDCAIGMSENIGDKSAIAFAASFYSAIAFGRSVQEAFEQGKVSIQLEGLSRYDVPTLLAKPGVDTSNLYVFTSGKNKDPLTSVQNTLLNGDYDSAFRDINTIIRTCSDEMTDAEMAKLKYLEALVHLEGKRPYMQSPSVMQTSERLMRGAIQRRHIYSYMIILAILKYDFARAGLYKHKIDADGLANDAQWLSPDDEDRENICNIFARAQPSLYQDFRHLFRM
jgi:CHAT domain